MRLHSLREGEPLTLVVHRGGGTLTVAPVASLAACRAILAGLDRTGTWSCKGRVTGRLTYVAIERSGSVLRRSAR